MTLSPQHNASRRSGWTLAETMISSSLITMLLAGLIAVHLGGLRLQRITQVKTGASDEARRALNSLIDDVRSAKLVHVGNGDLVSFTEISGNQRQEGNSIQIHSTTNTAQFVRYFWDPADQQLKRTADGGTAVVVLAGSVTNSVIFAAENAFGQVLTNNQNNRVIRLMLQFQQLVHPDLQFGAGGLFDHYQVQTRITRRTLE